MRIAAYTGQCKACVGLRIGFARKRMEAAVLEPFQEMNRALKQRAERRD